MVNRTFRLEIISLDLDLWQKLYYKHQQEYIRKRLLAIKYLYSGQTLPQGVLPVARFDVKLE